MNLLTARQITRLNNSDKRILYTGVALSKAAFYRLSFFKKLKVLFTNKKLK